MNPTTTRQLLSDFEFEKLFVEELGWSRPTSRQSEIIHVDDADYSLRQIAQLAQFGAFEVQAPGGKIPDAATRRAVHDEVFKRYREHILVFVDAARSQSDWYWVKREDGKRFPRDHYYVKGQPGDLFLSKIASMQFDLSDLDEGGNVSLIEVAKRVKDALDVERVTRKFYDAYKGVRLAFAEQIHGIDDEKERRWYASVILNRLMFIYFLQRKGFVDDASRRKDYLDRKLRESKQRGPDRFYSEFLHALFFEGFAKPPGKRSAQATALIGDVRYLNGGLFLPHPIEEKYGRIAIGDCAFDSILALFGKYSWNLNDTPGEDDDEISPDVLGYIFEKYINQKEFGAYYTRPEITEYLCEQTIHRLILDKVNPPEGSAESARMRRFDDVGELLMNLDAGLCRNLLFDILPSLSLLDPACGSGAFLVAAMKTLIDVYSAVLGRIPFVSDAGLRKWLDEIQAKHPSVGYYIKRTIITSNLYGVDIMAEGAEIARLRLFLALVSSAQTVEDLEPLPNIDFNILRGNSLIGLLSIRDLRSRDQISSGLFELIHQIDDRNRKIATYKQSNGYKDNLVALRDEIDAMRAKHYEELNKVLLTDGFKGIKYEQATWDAAKNKEGKPIKRPVSEDDIAALDPFHWGYEFDEIMNKRGGFDAIITNPPWESFKPIAKEFCYEFDATVERRGTDIKDFGQKLAELLSEPRLRSRYVGYLSSFPHVSAFYRSADQYRNQISVINGKKAGTDINLYKLFTEQCFNLLRKGGRCGIVIPSGIYTDLGTKQLREMLFSASRITGLFGFENRQTGGGVIFENVDSRFKFVLLTYAKGGETKQFPAAFMRHDAHELADFPKRGGLPISIDLIRRLSPDSLSLMEFKCELDVRISEKMLRFPLLGERIEGTWNLVLGNEFHMTNDSHLFKTSPGPGRLPLYEGKMIWHFEHGLEPYRYWIDASAGRRALLGRRLDSGQTLSYQTYRCGYRSITGATNQRTMVISLIPKSVFTGHSLNVSKEPHAPGAAHATAMVSALLSSFTLDYSIRQRVSTQLTMYFVYQLAVPRLTSRDACFRPIVERAARLICTTPEFADLWNEIDAEIGIDPGSAKPIPGNCLWTPNCGATSFAERARLRAELDGLIAHLYGLTEEEFNHVLSTFPLVPEPTIIAARNAYRDIVTGVVQ